MDLAGKNVVYLGGFGGIGQKACAELLERQLQVHFVGQNPTNGKFLTTCFFSGDFLLGAGRIRLDIECGALGGLAN